MASYNGARYIEPQIHSILTQLAPGDELIVVDDCSTDDTVARLRSLGDARIRIVQHTTNQGVVATFEEALRLARGDILFLSDQDDLWAQTKVRIFLEAFARHPEVKLMTSRVALIQGDGTPFSDARWDRGGRFRAGFWRNLLSNHYQGSAMGMRASLRNDILPFPRSPFVLHDIWIGTRNAIARGGTHYIDEPLLLYRRHPTNFSNPLTPRQRVRGRLSLLWEHVMFPWRRRGSPASKGVA
jgi:glycosyltransferase involved in cell wall biosynthesis